MQIYQFSIAFYLNSLIWVISPQSLQFFNFIIDCGTVRSPYRVYLHVLGPRTGSPMYKETFSTLHYIKWNIKHGPIFPHKRLSITDSGGFYCKTTFGIKYSIPWGFIIRLIRPTINIQCSCKSLNPLPLFEAELSW